MNYEQATKISNKGKSDRTKHNATSRTATKLCRMDAKTAGCKRDNARQKELGSCRGIADGFLRNLFVPKVKAVIDNHTSKTADRLTADFNRSLELVTSYYKIDLKPCKDLVYPYNISATLCELEKTLKPRLNNYEDVRLIKENSTVYIIVEDVFYTKMELFYMPVIPLYKALKRKNQRSTANLLLSIFSYLYSVANVPYYRDRDSFLYGNYEMIEDWEKEEGEPDSLLFQEINNAKIFGDYMLKKIKCPKNLHYLKNRIKAFIPTNDFDTEVLNLANQTLKLYKEFPKEQITRNVKQFGDLHHDENMTTLEQYVGFCADSDGNLQGQLLACVNSELLEYDIQHPIMQKKFNGNIIVETEESFEYKIFELISNLCTVLYKL